MTTREAVLSSKIEGTQATMGEVLEYEAAGAGQTIDPRKEADIEEVLNYRKAMRLITRFPTVIASYHRIRSNEQVLKPNPKLTHGQFVAANMTRAHLAPKIPEFSEPVRIRTHHTIFVADKAA